MARPDINTVRCEALFASALQRSDEASAADVRLAIMRTVREMGNGGCAAAVAQEFGDHPESAVARMRWARRLVEVTVAENQVAAAIHTLRYRQRPVATTAA